MLQKDNYNLKVFECFKKFKIITLRNRKMVFLSIRNGKQVISRSTLGGPTEMVTVT